MNMKKLFPEKKLTRKKILNFLDKRLFYVVLTLCICIVGATIYLTMGKDQLGNSNNSVQGVIPDEINNPASSILGKSPEKLVPNKSDEDNKSQAATPTKIVPSATPKVTPAVSAKPTNKPTNKSGKSVAKPASGKNIAEITDMIMPVFGQICVGYSSDKPVYSKTLEQWQTHKYVEIACEKGSAVKATADGYVCEIKDDPKYGITVVLDHSNGLKTVYANLASSNMVATNQKVSIGDIIGCVGNTAVFESAEQPHLHFEVLKNDKPVNPSSYLPKE
ncbi:Peptidase M23 [Pseudobacteroides cellulosolvens ATCC 35603 = DSM 2933]|uniref:Peptidase M23 n=2 Tax=Pseudobacteroides cellulosolvens TaxID=35825 RepID=A0A0L6JXD8_9FIRM|nr:Peptidase M23 [Pseudobacteroides cellulosolvens ATCC 35603 = DSM 2933]